MNLSVSLVSNASQGGSDQGDVEDAGIFDLNEPRTSDSDQVDEVHFKTLSKTNETLQSRSQKVDKPFKQVRTRLISLNANENIALPNEN